MQLLIQLRWFAVVGQVITISLVHYGFGITLPLPAMAPQTPLPSDFSGSWWSRDEGPAVLPSRTPVRMPIPAPLVAHAPAVMPVSEDELVRRVLAGITT